MKAGLVIYGPLDHRSGGYLYDAKLVKHLRACGDRVEVFSLPEVSYPLRFAHNLHVGFWKRLAKADLDVLLQDELNHPSLLLGNRWLRARVAYPIVSIVHHLYADEWTQGWRREAIARIERAYLAGVDALICNSDATLQRVRSLRGSCPSVVAPPGGDRLGALPTRAAIRRRAYNAGPLRVLFLGNVIPRKRLEIVLQALAQLPHEAWRLRVIGSLHADAAYASRMQRLCDRLKVEDRVDFLGRVSDESLRRVLERSHVLAVPSGHEGFGIVYLEAMGFGNAVIANEKSAPKNLLQDGQTGFLTAPEPKSVAAIFQKLHRNRRLLARIGLRARSAFDAHPTWRASGQTVRRFLQSLTVR